MAPVTPQPEPSEPPKIIPGGTYTIDDVGVGFKIWVKRPVPGGGEEQRKAEVLSVRERQKPLYPQPIPRAGASGNSDAPEDKREYYIHWVEFNKRLDEWVIGSRLVLSRELEWPKPKAPPPVAKKDTTPKAPSKAQKKIFSKKQEIEKLRHGGSMTQAVHEIARVKNLNRIQMGQHEVEAWYFSPYPVEYAHLPVLFVCEFCLSYFPSPKMFERHRLKCGMHCPPGNEIYRHEDISFFEIDGKKQLTWCRNLSLLSKCFLDHKTLYYDVQPFLYYVMTMRDSRGCHMVGYFSKEKESAEGYNVACILTLPQHQRFGYGKLLIEFSYELSKKEGKLGSPEKPLSDLGLLGYKAFWSEAIVEYLLTLQPGEDVSIETIANATAITPADIMYTCQAMHLIKSSRSQHVICLTDAIKEQYERAMKKRRRRINPDGLRDWKPPVFSRDQLRFGW
ncbi:Histone acetyltransferase [Tulasnella sp. 403]|nr:Histone acetyltransferase [Tulasnella sp. 403]